MMTTFSAEDSLPKLPLPELQPTFSQLEQSLKPLHFADGYYRHPLYPEESSTLSASISEFIKSEAAAKLQEKLKHFNKANACYLDTLHLDINNHTSTKEIQDDVLPRNPFLVLAEDAVPDVTQEDRCGVLCFSALRFVSALKLGILPPDYYRDGKPMSMVPYLNLFGTTRCPVFEQGEVESFDLNKPYTESDIDEEYVSDEELLNLRPPSASSVGADDELFSRHGITVKRYQDSKHILIISKGQYYTLDVLDEDNNVLYNESDLSKVFHSVLTDSQESYTIQKSTALGSLTSYSFKNWKYARKRLQKRYPKELTMIDSALFVVVLDESDAKDDNTNGCKRLFYGTSIIDEKTGFQIGSCTSRWYDKLQLVVTGDAKAAVIWDSFTCDGSVVLRFTSDMYAESILRLAREVNSGDARFSLWPKMKTKKPSTEDIGIGNKLSKINWSFSNILNTHVHLSETKLTDLISKHDIVHCSIPFGRRFAQRIGVRSDSMVQIALQVAHYALYGKMIFSFEPVSTRLFKNSRSTFISVQNQELLELCQLFISNSLDERGKLDKFIQACEKHSETIRQAQNGSGFEKHFNALKYLYEFHDHFDINLNQKDIACASAVFDSDLLGPFSAPELIASNCGNSAMTMFGVTPAVPQGFGIGYIIKPDQCDLTVTSQFRQGKRLMFMLQWVLDELKGYWKWSREMDGKAGIKISPLVDKLYEIDNALNSMKVDQKAGSSVSLNTPNGGYGFFDLKGHVESRTASRPISRNNSSMKLSELLTPALVATPSSVSVPTEKEKQSTGHQILKLDPPSKSPEAENATLVSSAKKNNVINSRFEINFDRGMVGRKVSTSDQ